jgi:hypothetical protein
MHFSQALGNRRFISSLFPGSATPGTADNSFQIAFPIASSATCYRRMAELLGTWPCQDDASGGLQNFMQRLIQGSRPAAAGLTL